jgi:hypothetical protein
VYDAQTRASASARCGITNAGEDIVGVLRTKRRYVEPVALAKVTRSASNKGGFRRIDGELFGLK